MSTTFIWNTGCTAKEPGERSTTPKTETKEEGQSFTADYILKAANCEQPLAATPVVVLVAAAAAASPFRFGAYRVSQP